VFTQLKPETDVAEKEVEITQKEFEENEFQNNNYRCYRRCRYYRNHNNRYYKRCYRRCYRYLENENQDLNDVEFFKGNVELAEEASKSTAEEKEVTEKEFEENRYYRCYRRCRYYRYHHRYYRRCYRRCYRTHYLEGKSTEELTDA
jgi:hypothetical protein